MTKQQNRKQLIQYCLRDTFPVFAGYIVLGIGFGILMQAKGYGWWWSLLMSASVFAGSMQYVAVDLLASGASLITGALMTLLINIRHLFYGITMLEEYKDVPQKPYLIFALTDETFSLVCSADLPEHIDRKQYYFFVSLLNHCYWVTGSLIGGLLGNIIPFDTTGVDFAMTALFVVIFAEQWEKSKNRLPAITGIVCSVASLILFGPSDFLIPAMVAISAALFVERRRLEGGEHA